MEGKRRVILFVLLLTFSSALGNQKFPFSKYAHEEIMTYQQANFGKFVDAGEIDFHSDSVVVWKIVVHEPSRNDGFFLIPTRNTGSEVPAISIRGKSEYVSHMQIVFRSIPKDPNEVAGFLQICFKDDKPNEHHSCFVTAMFSPPLTRALVARFHYLENDKMYGIARSSTLPLKEYERQEERYISNFIKDRTNRHYLPCSLDVSKDDKRYAGQVAVSLDPFLTGAVANIKQRIPFSWSLSDLNPVLQGPKKQMPNSGSDSLYVLKTMIVNPQQLYDLYCVANPKGSIKPLGSRNAPREGWETNTDEWLTYLA